MTHEISLESQQYLADAVASGKYDDTSQALDAAVELLRRRDQLRADVNVGIGEADRGELLPEEQVFERLERRAREIERDARDSG